jgi:hypothetical protein
MQGNRYDRGWGPPPRYGGDYGGRHGPLRGRAEGVGNGRRYDAGMRGGYDRGWTGDMAYGREPGMGMGMNGPGMFTPFGWDPMLRWAGWDPLAGYVPYQDSPREWSYGLAEDYRRYDHEYYRGNVAHHHGSRSRYGGDYDRGYREHRMPPRQSPLYGRGGDRALREWARSRGYDVGYTIQPRLGPRR